MEEKRKLKYMYQRMPDKKVGTVEIVNAIHKKTGFARMHIDEVIKELSNVIEESLQERKSVYLHNIGTIFPVIKPGKNVVKINKFKEKGAELMYMPARWVCKFKVKPSFAKKLLITEPTKEEVDNIYKD